MADIPVFTFAAFSGGGKTTYLERLIPALKDLGLRVGVVKHHGHDAPLDRGDKDSARLSRAGADAVAAVAPGETAFFENRPLSPEEAVSRIRGVDLILTEGFKGGPWPKIAIWRGGCEAAVPPERCVAVVSDVPRACAAPLFPLDDPAPMAAFLAAQIQTNAQGRKPS